jgi:thioredoxin-related protein
MKQLFWLMLMVVPFFAKAHKRLNVDNKEVKWVEGLSWDQVRERAKKESKFIFVDAYATWCSPCKKMDREVYTNHRVAEAINNCFIAVKVQMDKTPNDDEQVKSWYSVAESFNGFGIEGYPSFLFFTPDGKLAYKAVGYHDADGFIALTNEALTDPNTRYVRELEKFNKGQILFLEMPELARKARKKKDMETAIKIVKQFKSEYVDKLSDEKAFTGENLSILGEFSTDVLTSEDRYFKFFKDHSYRADSIINRIQGGELRSVSKLFVSNIIRKEEIIEIIYIQGRPITSPKPDWHEIKKSISKKYGPNYIDQFFPDEQIFYYFTAKDWGNYVSYVNLKIRKFPPKNGGKSFGPQFGDSWQLNMYAWVLFQGCNNKRTLEKGLSWVNLSLKLKETGYAMDTKANLLYKIGRVPEAIEFEAKALTLSKYDRGIQATLEKMKAGVSTWP